MLDGTEAAILIGASLFAVVVSWRTLRQHAEWPQTDAIVCYGSEAEAAAEGEPKVGAWHLMFEAPDRLHVIPYGDPTGAAPPFPSGTLIRIAYNPAHPSDVIMDTPRQIVLGGVFFLGVFALTVMAVVLSRS